MSKDPSLADLRQSYDKGSLEDHEAVDDPLRQFGAWLGEALDKKLPEPNAMTVATVGADGRPSTRVVLIKGYDARGISGTPTTPAARAANSTPTPSPPSSSTGSSWNG